MKLSKDIQKGTHFIGSTKDVSHLQQGNLNYALEGRCIFTPKESAEKR